MLLEPRRNYLKVNDCHIGDEIKFLNEGEWLESKRYTTTIINPDGSESTTPQKQFVILIDHGGESKHLTLNSTNRNMLIQHFGKETKNWIDKKAKIELIRQNVAGNIKDVIYLDPIIE